MLLREIWWVFSRKIASYVYVRVGRSRDDHVVSSREWAHSKLVGAKKPCGHLRRRLSEFRAASNSHRQIQFA